MLEQAYDLRDESEGLYAILHPLGNADWERKTQFKGWTLNDVIAHLHLFNHVADLSMTDEQRFMEFAMKYYASVEAKETLLDFSDKQINGVKGRKLLLLWRDYYQDMAERLTTVDPRRRVKWFGPDMSVLSSISARIMETWSHGQGVYDLLGQQCEHTDRIKSIAVIGINTFGFTYKNRGLAIPEPMPYVRLRSPSEAVWEWNEPSSDNSIEGNAVEFCQVLTQCRNIADTDLQMNGEIALQWMSIGQCFAGPPETPPVAGTRFRQS